MSNTNQKKEIDETLTARDVARILRYSIDHFYKFVQNDPNFPAPVQQARPTARKRWNAEAISAFLRGNNTNRA